MEEETWRDIEGYEGFYQISNDGKVKSLGRVAECGPGRFRHSHDRLLSTKTSSGYCMAYLYRNGDREAVLVHRLVAIAFIPNPDNKPFINHKNGIKDDNRVENLEWCTSSENVRHALNKGLKTPAMGERVNTSKLTSSDVVKINELLKTTTLLHREIADLFGVDKGSISKIQRNKTWKHIK